MTIEFNLVMASGDVEELLMDAGYSPDVAAEVSIHSHSHLAAAISYSNAASGLSAIDVQAAIDEIVASGGVIEFGATATATTGTIEGDVNAMDWTGHDYASGSALNIPVNALVYFTNGGSDLYKWMGPKGITVGQGGSYVTVAEDYTLLATTADHNTLTGRDVAEAHPIDAITQLDFELAQRSPVGHTHFIPDVADLEEVLGEALYSHIEGVPGAIRLNNALQMAQEDYDLITPDPRTIYFLTGIIVVEPPPEFIGTIPDITLAQGTLMTPQDYSGYFTDATSYAYSPPIAGLTMDSVTGILSGTPTSEADTSTIVTATNVGGNTPSNAFSVNVTAVETLDRPDIIGDSPAGWQQVIDLGHATTLGEHMALGYGGDDFKNFTSVQPFGDKWWALHVPPGAVDVIITTQASSWSDTASCIRAIEYDGQYNPDDCQLGGNTPLNGYARNGDTIAGHAPVLGYAMGHQGAGEYEFTGYSVYQHTTVLGDTQEAIDLYNAWVDQLPGDHS